MTKGRIFTTLMVDGDFGAEDELEEFLKGEEHFVLKAESAEEALAMTRRFRPDLILLDGEMAGVSGLVLLPELMLEHSTAAFIVLATTPRLSLAVRALRWGMVDVLDRPLDLKKLKLAIDAQKDLFELA